MNKMKSVVEGQLKTDVPEFSAGDTDLWMYVWLKRESTCPEISRRCN